MYIVSSVWLGSMRWITCYNVLYPPVGMYRLSHDYLLQIWTFPWDWCSSGWLGIRWLNMSSMCWCLVVLRQVTEVQVNSLPSHDTSTYTSTQCDSCIKKGDDKKAVVYCIKCDRKYCKSHLNVCLFISLPPFRHKI